MPYEFIWCPFGLQIEFITLDITTKDLPRQYYDIVFCFSVTLWIHINHGDVGLQNFLSKISSISKYLVIETQPWKCYRTAARRALRSGQPPFPHYDSLTIRNNVTEFIDKYLIESCGLVKVTVLGTTNWGRQITLYRQPDWYHHSYHLATEILGWQLIWEDNSLSVELSLAMLLQLVSINIHYVICIYSWSCRGSVTYNQCECRCTVCVGP